MAYYDDDITTADELIREFGEIAQFVRMSTVTPNPDEPWNTGQPVEQSQDIPCVFLNFNTQQQYFQGSEIPRGAKKILMSCVGLDGEVPLQSQIRRANGEIWKVNNFKLLDPNGQRILYTLMGVQ